MRIALLEVVATQGGHEVEFDRLIVHSLRALGHQPVFLVPPNFSFKIDYQAETHFYMVARLLPIPMSLHSKELSFQH